jgi:hypothetical protein
MSDARWFRDEARALSTEQERILREQEIDEEGPGTILRDLSALLTYVEEEGGVRVTDKLRRLPLRALPEINARMTHPLELGLQRPVQKSFPYIHGLYLLVRASGLTRVREGAGRPTLVVDEAVRDQWLHLNPTERYFTLLETWLLRARPETIGEGRPGMFSVLETYGECLSLLRRIPEGGLVVPETDAQDWLRFSPGWHNLGLLDLFGLVSVEDRPSEPGEGWQIERIEIEPLGDAMISLLLVEFFGDFDNILAFSGPERVPVGTLQPVLQPYFPEWRRNLGVSEWSFREGTYVFAVSLGDLWWGRIALPATATLEALATAIINAIEFTHDHLYQFSYRDRFGALQHVYHSYMDDGPWADDVRIGDLPLEEGQEMTYLYDFGDQWEFSVTLERIDPPDRSLKAPAILEEGGDHPRQYPAWDSWE